MNKQQHINNINRLAAKQTPFIFIIDFLGNKAVIQELNKTDSNEILFSVNGINNISQNKTAPTPAPLAFKKFPISIKEYEKSFTIVKENLKQGNSYLTNLTCKTPIETNISLKEIFYRSKAPYKLWYKNQFVVFSPEIFVKTANGKIFSYPMKGTIDAKVHNAEKTILNNKKETAEHATIVDLIRNDLSRIATDVQVDRYRYIDKIKTNENELLQVSSQISGNLPDNYHKNLGNIIFELLPAGSISGAPKYKTIEIINKAENYKRSFYTGIFGIFDGKELDSCVMIRFIENSNGQLFFKSGGGITVNSNMQDEYNEMIQKVYLPI